MNSDGFSFPKRIQVTWIKEVNKAVKKLNLFILNKKFATKNLGKYMDN